MNAKTTDWKFIYHTVTRERYIGARLSERLYNEASDKTRFRASKSSLEAKLNFFENQTEFTCGHGRLYWKPCKNCHRNSKSAKVWFERLAPRLREVLGLV